MIGTHSLWDTLAISLVALLALLLTVFGRRRYRQLSTLFPTPPILPIPHPNDDCPNILCFIQVPAGGSELGGSGHHVVVYPDGFKIQGSWYLGGGQSAWIPWTLVENCEELTGIDPGGEDNPAGTRVALKNTAAVLRVADPAGERLFGYWRLYQRQLRAAAG